VSDDMMDQGMTTRREVLGDAYVDRAMADADAFTADFQEYITRAAWGSVWSRPGLDRRTRSCITVAMLAAQGSEHELAMHVRAALRNGVSVEEIKEILLQVAVYAGVPRANRAFSVARDALSSTDASTEST
jgi:4-carboxymuconolactone decarboxylase